MSPKLTTCKIDSVGRLQIPKEIRLSHGLHPGTEVHVDFNKTLEVKKLGQSEAIDAALRLAVDVTALLRGVDSQYYEAWRKLLARPQRERVTEIVCKEYGVSRRELDSSLRTGPVVLARHVAYYLMYKEFADIGFVARVFNQPQSSVGYGINEIQNRLEMTSFKLPAETL